MKQLSYVATLLALLSLWSCSTPSSKNDSPVRITYTELTGDAARTVAVLAVDGMTCSHGCGGKIQQDLRKLAGVKATDLDYLDDRETNLVSVEYDPATVTEAQLIEAVHGIADGRYRVVEMEVRSTRAPGGEQSQHASGQSSSVAFDFSAFYQVFNLLSTFLYWVG